MRLFISSGDVSGDMHGGMLIRALEERLDGLRAFGLGGPRMAAAGVHLLGDTQSMSAIGLVETLRYVAPSLWLLHRARRFLATNPVDLAVLIDYPGLNVPLAGFIQRRCRVPVIYYIPPEEWVWSTKGNRRMDRTRRIAASTDHVLAVHPREAAHYTRSGCAVELVGHPLQDSVAAHHLEQRQARARLGLPRTGPVVALFPASRAQELRLVWPVIAAAAARLCRTRPGVRFLIPPASVAMAKALEAAIVDAYGAHPELRGRIRLIEDEPDGLPATVLAAAAADAAIAKSGSVTLELALRGVPQVVVYRLGRVTEWLARRLLGLSEVDFEFVALPNLIARRGIVPEFMQHDARPEAIANALGDLLEPRSAARAAQLAGVADLERLLGGRGAVERAADAVVRIYQKTGPVKQSAS